MADITFVVNEFSGSREEFLALTSTFFSDHSELRGFESINDHISDLLSSDHDYYQITSDSEVAGLAAVKLENETIHFDVFVVDPEFREVGVGDELFSTIISMPKYVDAKHYESRALPGDRHTKNFFETRKGKARLLIVRGEISREH
mgnify:CR=1 FL=1